MSSKKSAFSVFKSREKSETTQSDENDLTLVAIRRTNTELEVEKVVSLFCSMVI